MKKLMTACGVMAISLGLWAFTESRSGKDEKQALTPAWYYWNGNESKFDQENYTLTPTSTDCSGSSVLCAIYVEPDGTYPQYPSEAGIAAAAASSDDFEEESGIVELKNP